LRSTPLQKLWEARDQSDHPSLNKDSFLAKQPRFVSDCFLSKKAFQILQQTNEGAERYIKVARVLVFFVLPLTNFISNIEGLICQLIYYGILTFQKFE